MTTITSPAAQEWDQLRAAFASSLMADTALSSLAQNLDGLDWPIEGPGETPAAYLDFNYNELRQHLASRGHAAAADLLIQILRETLAFDQPFGEMVRQTETFAERDNPLLRTFARLGIPENFPIALCSLDAPARDLCELEEISTLGQFAIFAQRIAQGVIVGGDLKRLLNALAHVDEKALAELIPFRTGSTGVHLAEALAHAAASAAPEKQTAEVVAWFSAEVADWRTEAARDPRFLSRQLAVLDDRAFETTVTRLLAPHLGLPVQPTSRWAFWRRWFNS